ncbi:MAG: TetR/AcrR family transcriptional regulator [Frankiales bacterium]|nr:TetR/AcrR family transcriptional regulator [Frankiales bacterium]
MLPACRPAVKVAGATLRSVTTPAEPRPRAARDRRDRYSLSELLEVVASEFLERGYDATSMEDLSRATGRTKSSIYHHVSGKEELLRLAVARAVDALFAVLDEESAQQGRAVERLEHVVRGSARVLAAELPYVTLLLRVRGNTEAERWALGRRREFDRRLALLVRAAIEEGDVRDDLDPRLVTRLLFGMVNSLVEWFRPGGAHGQQQVEDALVALAFSGLRPR